MPDDWYRRYTPGKELYELRDAGISLVNPAALPAWIFTLPEDYVEATLLYIRNEILER
jgi:hypothetical protein